MAPETHWIERDGEHIFGTLHQAEQDRGTVLLLHGFTGSHIGPKYAYVALARQLCDAGFTVCRFDYRGSGNSDGAFRDQHLGTAVEDVEAVMTYLSELAVNTETVGLVGYSMGGTVALQAANRLDTAPGAVSVWATAADYRETFASTELDRIQEQDAVSLFGFDYPTEHVERMFATDPAALVSDLSSPLFVGHAANDRIVPFSHAETLRDRASGPTQLHTVAAGGHHLVDQERRETLVAATATWMDNRL